MIDGHVNVSPRGLPGTFAVLDEHTFAWLDVTGSGSETIAHLRENSRVTVMFCAFTAHQTSFACTAPRASSAGTTTNSSHSPGTSTTNRARGRSSWSTSPVFPIHAVGASL
ncbi:pyridoxamine 5'-phosphate oxidase family protein [Arthrobacter sp.]|uniref:pyridoxamine 5'-phosphate oxidase family protein n=1 Tax=Arthrobacter sp. TaxID=1667 RepID=UPI00281272CE|nr:pyridoxamine 5'-phosphate oxidase family protein [Arthrobacter sp.]